MSESEPKKFALVNITWNNYEWKKIDKESDTFSNFEHIQADNIGHEHLNFKFDKSGIDDETFVLGYAPAFSKNLKLVADGSAIVFFVSNSKNGTKIVGIYGGAERVEEKRYPHKEFKHEEGLLLNIRGKKSHSIHFSRYLDKSRYKKSSIGRAGINYIKKDLAEKIILDEIAECDEYDASTLKLHHIFEDVFGRSVEGNLQSIVKDMSKDQLKKSLQESSNLEFVEYHGQRYKRNDYAVALIKEYREHKCQMCCKAILKKDGTLYVEGAHIKPKSEGGGETLGNILVLCPNHHKEFDYGSSNITRHTDDAIELSLNGTKYALSLT